MNTPPERRRAPWWAFGLAAAIYAVWLVWLGAMAVRYKWL